MTYLRVKVTRMEKPNDMDSKYIPDFDANETVDSLFPKILNPNESPEAFDIQCICCGELLEASKRLSDYDIDASCSLLHFLVKPKPAPIEARMASGNSHPRDLKNLLIGLSWIIRGGQLSKVVSVLNQRDYLDRAVITDPALGQDTLAFSVLQDSKMLTTLLRHRGSLEKFLTEHPSVVAVIHSAIQSVVAAMDDPRRIQLPTSIPGLQAIQPVSQDYTIDQEHDSDQEEDSGNEPTPNNNLNVPVQTEDSLYQAARSQPGASGPRVSPRVSRHQLQAAIAQAQGLLTAGSVSQPLNSPQSDVSNEMNATRCPSSRNRITSNALSQALASATSSLQQPAVGPTVPNNSGSTDPWATQLTQLAEMGITDQQAARRVLEATNGDLALAIQLLFG